MADHRVPGMLHDRLLATSAGPEVARQRRALLARVTGRVLALGDRSGVDLVRHAAPDRVVVLDPRSSRRGRRTSTAGRSAEGVEVVAAGIDDVAAGRACLPGGPFDAVVSEFALCAVPDLDQAVRAIGQVLAPEGDLVFLEHGRGVGMAADLQARASPSWSHWTGCHLDRDVVGALRAAGLVVTRCQRFRLPLPPVLAGAQGVARHKPAVVATAEEASRREAVATGAGVTR